MELIDLYAYAEDHNIRVDDLPLYPAKAMSIQLEDGTCAIAIDYSQITTTAEEKTMLGHEIAHCKTGSFYNPHSPCDVPQKHEHCADKWEVIELIPKDELDKAVSCGIIEIWELAEYFNVTEDFMRKAVCWYEKGTLNTDWFFAK